MITFRWFTLRLFSSLIFLLLLAVPLLWLLHEVIYPNVDLDDEVIIVLLGILLYFAVNRLLHRVGEKRFVLLEQAGRELLHKSDEGEVEKVLAHLQKLFQSGLLSNGFQQKFNTRLLRQYFSFYAAHPEKEIYREQLMAAWHRGIRAEESYDLLKTHVLQQPALTLATIDLAEELLDRQPDDGELLTFLTKQYLRERRTHFRAERTFAQYLARNGSLVSEILSLHLSRLLEAHRQDDLALWCYVRAFQRDEEKNTAIRQQLYEAHQRFQQRRRHDLLAKAVATIAAEFTSEEIKNWTIRQEEKQARSWQFRAARLFFEGQQQILELYSRLREQRKIVFAVAGAVLILSLGYLALSNRSPAKVAAPNSIPPEDTTKVYYALQVGAIRSASTAQREAEKLRRRGLEVHVLKPEPSQRLHRLRVGKYRSKPLAQMAADSLKTAGIMRDYFIAEYEKQ